MSLAANIEQTSLGEGLYLGSFVLVVADDCDSHHMVFKFRKVLMQLLDWVPSACMDLDE